MIGYERFLNLQSRLPHEDSVGSRQWSQPMTPLAAQLGPVALGLGEANEAGSALE